MPQRRTSAKSSKKSVPKARRSVSGARTSQRKQLADPGFEMLALAALALGFLGLAAVAMMVGQYLGFLTA